MKKLGPFLWLAGAVYVGMLLQQAILHRQGYTIEFSALGKGDAGTPT